MHLLFAKADLPNLPPLAVVKTFWYGRGFFSIQCHSLLSSTALTMKAHVEKGFPLCGTLSEKKGQEWFSRLMVKEADTFRLVFVCPRDTQLVFMGVLI